MWEKGNSVSPKDREREKNKIKEIHIKTYLSGGAARLYIKNEVDHCDIFSRQVNASKEESLCYECAKPTACACTEGEQ